MGAAGQYQAPERLGQVYTAPEETGEWSPCKHAGRDEHAGRGDWGSEGAWFIYLLPLWGGFLFL